GYHSGWRCWRDLSHDCLAIDIALRLVAPVLDAAVLPFPAAEIPRIGAEAAGRVDDRQALRSRRAEQRLHVRDRHPGVLAAGIRPALDRFQDRLGPVAAEIIVDVDQQDRRALAEALRLGVAGGREHRLVARGEEFVPDAFGHVVLVSESPPPFAGEVADAP